MNQNTLKNKITIIIVLYREDYQILYQTLDKIRDFKKIIIDNSNNLELKNNLEANFKIEKYILNKKNIVSPPVIIKELNYVKLIFYLF